MKSSLRAFSVVTVPFPFTDCVKAKHRPALVLSSGATFNNVIGHGVMAMITSAKNSAWPLDVEIKDLKQAGLPSSSIVRMKLFTIDHRLVLSTLGHLSDSDSARVRASIQKLLDEHPEK
ncbi:MAG: transcriptional regulator [Bdellovibrionales bacterium RIFOXYD1_FULL_53_11]|nr:MAG: transcriptional regulator [Bdellovibrionales bacterium RIFOXYD1_FULL_53_11]